MQTALSNPAIVLARLPGRVTSRQAAIRWLLAVCGFWFACTTASLGPTIFGESDASAEQSESIESLAVCVPHGPNRREAPTGKPTRAITRDGQPRSSSVVVIAPATRGHRLASGLCAPLRC